jgi:hypothetical protein
LPEVSDQPSPYAHSCEETEAGSPEQVDAIRGDLLVQPEKPPTGTEVEKSSLNTWFQPGMFPLGIGTPDGLPALTAEELTPIAVNGSPADSNATSADVHGVVIGVDAVVVVAAGGVLVGVEIDVGVAITV